MVTRLSHQKGLDLVDHVLSDILGEGVQLAVLGKGDDKYVGLFNWAAWRYQGQVAARIEMNGPLSHRMYAGADMFLMPSLFEPCGLSQLIAMRYGTLPIVRETGGLKDTITDSGGHEGNGFTFKSYNAHDMLAAVKRAIAGYYAEDGSFAALVNRAMCCDNGWGKSANEYIRLYRALTKG